MQLPLEDSILIVLAWQYILLVFYLVEKSYIVLDKNCLQSYKIHVSLNVLLFPHKCYILIKVLFCCNYIWITHTSKYVYSMSAVMAHACVLYLSPHAIIS
jgi:hypothetical protein